MSALSQFATSALPACKLDEVDHYTLIVEDAETVARFHSDVLGFELVESRPLNTGTAPAGDYDMLNFIMRFPGESGRTLVITEGLTDESVFRRHLREHGPGVHHVAFQVEDIEGAVMGLREAGARLLSETIMRDARTGLRQVFVDLPGAGYTLELIERADVAEMGDFEDQNMVGLARSIDDEMAAAHRSPDLRPVRCVTRRLPAAAAKVIAVLADPARLGEWTGHRTVRLFGEEWREVRFSEDVLVTCEVRDGAVCYGWHSQGVTKEFTFVLLEEENSTVVSIELTEMLDVSDRQRLEEVLEAEFVLLAGLLGEVGDPETVGRAHSLVEKHAQQIVSRRGL